ncbi:MAG: ATP-binding protein, partial [Bacilli bacterium]
LWENFDLLQKSTGSVYSELSKYKGITGDYISLIFHRFLNKDKKNKLKIKINNFSLIGLDPFLENHPKTTTGRIIEEAVVDSFGIDRLIRVQPFVLPFQKDLTKEDEKKLGGVENYKTQQGFYVYRNERLIIWGTWFGRPRAELTKHARIKVDIPNSLDDIWGIDVKKQNAKIPLIIKHKLTKAVDEAMDTAIKKQKYRGRIEKINDDYDYIWDRINERDNHFSYKINREAKIFDLIKDEIDGATWNKLEMVFEEIENSIPYQQIYIDKSQNKVIDEVSDERIKDVKYKAVILMKMALDIGNTNKEDFLKKLFNSEPFSKYPDLMKELLIEEN